MGRSNGMLVTILLIVLILALVGALPAYGRTARAGVTAEVTALARFEILLILYLLHII